MFYASLFGQVKGQLIKEIENSPEDYLKTFNQNSNFSDYAFRLFGDEQYIVREDKRAGEPIPLRPGHIQVQLPH